ncbi:SsgA family sporulation/cell division regulator [Streptomyces sp. NPDC001530]|uniref:SsgA family sporulation/cell division regulator n=1 Tax=Streptomyces sp. NPDC001530 TaxID=3364582 RepID=UPI00367D13F8
MKSLSTVACELPVRLVVSHELSLPLHMGLRYEAADPFAVRAAFSPVGDGPMVEWVFARDVLAQALTGHAGHGDVRMWPADGEGQRVLYIALNSPAGSALLEVPARGVEFFLRDTQSVVPPGTESDRLDLDSELAHLLAES